jgi:hypothetical protein
MVDFSYNHSCSLVYFMVDNGNNKNVSVFLVFNAKKSTQTEQNWFGLNRFSVRSELY